MRLFFFIIMLISILFGDDDYEKRDNHYYSKDLTFLNLSAEQKERFKDVLKEYRKDIKEYREDKDKIIYKKQELFSKDSFDEIKFKKLNDEISEISSNIEIKLLKNIHKVLSNEQRQKFISYIDEWEIE